MNSRASSYLPLAALLILPGCASILDGTSQEIYINTNPAGATCTMEREGKVIATINSTPAATLVRKSKHDITLTCKLPGYQASVYVIDSGLATGAVAGNVAADLLLTAGLSSIIDSATGADNQYESPVNMTLIPE